MASIVLLFWFNLDSRDLDSALDLRLWFSLLLLRLFFLVYFWRNFPSRPSGQSKLVLVDTSSRTTFVLGCFDSFSERVLGLILSGSLSNDLSIDFLSVEIF